MISKSYLNVVDTLLVHTSLVTTNRIIIIIIIITRSELASLANSLIAAVATGLVIQSIIATVSGHVYCVA